MNLHRCKVVIEMKIVHVFDKRTNTLIDIFFIDKSTGKKVDYTVEEFKKSIKQ